MNEHPIIFSGQMVRAIIEGRKTQTRRIAPSPTASLGISPKDCKYQPGEKLWVRETCRAYELADDDPPKFAKRVSDPEILKPGLDGVIYRADDEFRPIDNAVLASERWLTLWHYGGGMKGRWIPPIHMPRWAARLFLRVTGVRVERLQDISDADARAEGMDFDSTPDGEQIYAFRNLWNEINAKRAPWASNPYVWVIEFERNG